MNLSYNDLDKKDIEILSRIFKAKGYELREIFNGPYDPSLLTFVINEPNVGSFLLQPNVCYCVETPDSLDKELSSIEYIFKGTEERKLRLIVSSEEVKDDYKVVLMRLLVSACDLYVDELKKADCFLE